MARMHCVQVLTTGFWRSSRPTRLNREPENRRRSRESLARQPGAHAYLDTATQDPAAELQELGGARVILAAATSSKAMNGEARCRAVLTMG